MASVEAQNDIRYNQHIRIDGNERYIQKFFERTAQPKRGTSCFTVCTKVSKFDKNGHISGKKSSTKSNFVKYILEHNYNIHFGIVKDCFHEKKFTLDLSGVLISPMDVRVFHFRCVRNDFKTVIMQKLKPFKYHKNKMHETFKF